MIDFLEQGLKTIDLSVCERGNRNKGTEIITSYIRNFAFENGFEYEEEVFLGLTRKTNGYKGLVDITIKRPDGARYAIEIDRGNKRWSLEKLLHAYTKGYVPIWVRWSADDKNYNTRGYKLDRFNKGRFKTVKGIVYRYITGQEFTLQVPGEMIWKEDYFNDPNRVGLGLNQRRGKKYFTGR